MTVRPGPTTTQADLDKLGYSSDRIKERLNSIRPLTLTEVHINDQFCISQQWRLQNAVLGPPVKTIDNPIDSESVRIMYHYDNSMSQETTKTEVFDERTNVLREALGMETFPKIKLNARIEFPSQTKDLDVPPALIRSVPILNTEAGGFSYTSQDDAPLFLDIKIDPGEAVDLWRFTSETGSNTKWEVPYGFEGKIGTHGTKWMDCEDWAWGFNALFPDPPQRLTVYYLASLTKVRYLLLPSNRRAQAAPQRSANWHPTSTVVVTDVSRQIAHEFHIGEAINV